MTIDITPYRNAIVQAFPELENASLRPLTMGWHSLAIDADGRLIFKFPRGDAAAQALRREARLLSAIRPRISMRVPDLTLIESPMLFSVHAKIEGEHLVTEDYERLPDPARERLAEDLARFYAELHALDPVAMRNAGATDILPWRSPQEIRLKALPLVPREHRRLCERTIEAYEAMAPDPLGNIYGFFDGHGWNMAFDHARQRINGVYDFADSGFGPLHQDFVYSGFISLALTRMIADRYARLTGKSIDRERIGILAGMHRLSELAELAGDRRNELVARQALAFWAANVDTVTL
jgi:aminoglycoside phosphotransferase (APT) family kinase protein